MSAEANLRNCKGQYKFIVKRAPVIGDPDNYSDDGAFMYDQTVEADLVRPSDGEVVVMHPYGSGSINTNVQIDAGLPPTYQANFAHPEGTSLTVYVLKVYFQDVDDIRRLQATSDPLSF